MLRDNYWKLAILTAIAISGPCGLVATAAPPYGSGTIRQTSGGAGTHARDRAPSTAHAQSSSGSTSLADRLLSLGNRILGDTTPPEATQVPPRQAPADWSHLAHPVPGSRPAASSASRGSTPNGASRRGSQDEDIFLPEPPVEDAPAGRKSAEPVEEKRTPAVDRSESSADADASSSRRSGRRDVEPMDEYDAAGSQPRTTSPSPSTAKREVAPVPKVSRRPLPSPQSRSASQPSSFPSTDSTASSSRRADATGASSTAGPDRSAASSIPSISGETASAPSAEDTSANMWQQTGRRGADASSAPSVSRRRPLASNSTGYQASVPQQQAAPNESAHAPGATPSASASTIASERSPGGIQASQQSTASNATATVQLAATEVPSLRVTTNGPRQVTIGVPAKFEVVVENRGTMDVTGLVVRATLPSWINLSGHRASRGEAVVQESGGERIMMWQVSNLAGGGTEQLSLELAPQEAKPFDVQIEWTLMPLANVASIAVQEPKLDLQIHGPDQVTYGDSKVYSVRVLNPGTGVAEDVVFTLSPNSATPQRQSLGDIPPGQEAQFEVELSAHDNGSLEIHGLVTAAANLRDEEIKQVDVASAELTATLDGPPIQYKDSEAVYYLTLTNKGSATCENIVAALQLPPGMEYIQGIPGATPQGDSLRWTVPRLEIGQAEEYEITCRLTRTGSNQLAFQCEGSAAGRTSVSLATEVEAIADLALTVKDPPAPAPLGEDVVYEIVIRNRGSKAAENVTAVAQFSNGIEPSSASGHAHEIVPGQVLFEEIPRIEAGAEIRLQIVAQADAAGVHRFRSEIRSGETVLVAEEATRYITLTASRSSRTPAR